MKNTRLAANTADLGKWALGTVQDFHHDSQWTLSDLAVRPFLRRLTTAAVGTKKSTSKAMLNKTVARLETLLLLVALVLHYWGSRMLRVDDFAHCFLAEIVQVEVAVPEGPEGQFQRVGFALVLVQVGDDEVLVEFWWEDWSEWEGCWKLNEV